MDDKLPHFSHLDSETMGYMSNSIENLIALKVLHDAGYSLNVDQYDLIIYGDDPSGEIFEKGLIALFDCTDSEILNIMDDEKNLSEFQYKDSCPERVLKLRSRLIERCFEYLSDKLLQKYEKYPGIEDGISYLHFNKETLTLDIGYDMVFPVGTMISCFLGLKNNLNKVIDNLMSTNQKNEERMVS